MALADYEDLTFLRENHLWKLGFDRAFLALFYRVLDEILAAEAEIADNATTIQSLVTRVDDLTTRVTALENP